MHAAKIVLMDSIIVQSPGFVPTLLYLPSQILFFLGGLHILEQSSLPNCHDWISAIFGLNILRRFIILLNLYSFVVISVGTLIMGYSKNNFLCDVTQE